MSQNKNTLELYNVEKTFMILDYNKIRSTKNEKYYIYIKLSYFHMKFSTKIHKIKKYCKYIIKNIIILKIKT